SCFGSELPKVCQSASLERPVFCRNATQTAACSRMVGGMRNIYCVDTKTLRLKCRNVVNSPLYKGFLKFWSDTSSRTRKAGGALPRSRASRLCSFRKARSLGSENVLTALLGRYE